MLPSIMMRKEQEGESQWGGEGGYFDIFKTNT